LSPPAPAETSRRLGLAAVAAGTVLWALGPVLVKGTDVEGLAFGFHRSWIAALFFGAGLYLTGRRLTWATLWRSRWGGLALTADLAFFFSAVKLTTVSNAVVISALQPAIVLVAVGPFFGERVGGTQIAWTLLSIVGAAVVAFGSAGEVGWHWKGDLLAVGAVIAWSAYFIASKEARRHLGSLEYQTSLFVITAVLLLPITLVSGQSLAIHGASTAAGVLAMALIAGTGHILINWAHGSVPLSVTSMMTLALPVVSSVAAWMFLDEPLTVVQMAGMAIVLVSLAMVVTRKVGPEPVATAPSSSPSRAGRSRARSGSD
jgi:drug/metabolite transporter (DMT)-like permease